MRWMSAHFDELLLGWLLGCAIVGAGILLATR